jgi:uncharacterized iron-regulated membrane protein
MFLCVLMWAVTALYFAFPETGDALIHHYQVNGDETTASLAVRATIVEITNLHFGRTYGPIAQALWAFLGLVPAAMFITGGLMWWNRVVRRAVGQRAAGRASGRTPSRTLGSLAPDERHTAERSSRIPHVLIDSESTAPDSLDRAPGAE